MLERQQHIDVPLPLFPLPSLSLKINKILKKKKRIKDLNVKNKTFFVVVSFALADMAQGIEYWPANQRVTGSIPSLGHMPGLLSRSPVGGV